ncbi:hypothetical protein C8R45DRAFT_144151 [Mycena sanguinolenta]|nr:hypothetical protein C8R45DRAFT_144151 [Mycena sanguinolenta]
MWVPRSNDLRIPPSRIRSHCGYPACAPRTHLKLYRLSSIKRARARTRDDLQQRRPPCGRVVRLRTPPTPSLRCRCPPRWSVTYDVRRDLQRRLGSRYRPALTLATRTHWTFHAGANPSPTRTTSCMRHWRASPLTSPRRLEQCTCIFHRPTPAPVVLPGTTFTTSCARWSFPIAGAAFVASSRVEPVSSKYPYSPIQTRAGHILHTAAPPPACGSRSPSPAPRLSPSRPAHRVQ